MLPTILGVAGVEIPSHVQGRSLLPAITRGEEVHETVVAGYLLSLVKRERFGHVQLLAAARGNLSEEMLERLRALGYIR